MEHGCIYISFHIKNEMINLNDNRRDVLGFKRNIINGKSAGIISGIELDVFADYPPGFSLENLVFIYGSFVETKRVGINNILILRDL